MKIYQVSISIKGVEAVSETEAINEFEKLVIGKKLGFEDYTVREIENKKVVEGREMVSE